MIPSKKLCACGQRVYSRGLCPTHYRESRPQKKRKSIKPVSSKRRAEGKEYSKIRREFLTSNPLCAVCRGIATEVHHKARRGQFYLRVDTWLQVCDSCHKRIEENGKWAVENGFTYSQQQLRELRNL